MKVFICTSFKGHWDVGTAAVVVASDTMTAKRLLNDALQEQGLPGGVKTADLQEVNTDEASVDILLNGDY